MEKKTPLPGLGSDKRPSLATIDDIRAEIVARGVADRIVADKTIELGPCGMGMPVLRSRWALDEMAPGQILKTVSGHT